MTGMTEALRGADPEQGVDACPGWTVRDLAWHLIGVHRWARAALDSDGAPAYDESPIAGDFVETYRLAAQDLLEALRSRDGDSPAWTFDRTNRTASFWHRRQLHEIAVHRWDVEPYPFADDVAIDGIDEVLSFMLPRMQASGRATLAQGSLHLAAPTRSWTIGSGTPETTVESSPGELLLLLWGRAGSLPGAWSEAKLTP